MSDSFKVVLFLKFDGGDVANLKRKDADAPLTNTWQHLANAFIPNPDYFCVRARFLATPGHPVVSFPWDDPVISCRSRRAASKRERGKLCQIRTELYERPSCKLIGLTMAMLIHRFGHSTLHQRDSRSALFEGYSGSGRNSADPTRRPSPALGGYGYGYPGGSNGSAGGSTHLGVESRGGYRPATPNHKYGSTPKIQYEDEAGQYSDAVLNELESQNDQQVEGILGKVKVLKDVSFIVLLLLRVS
ncbi:hypothetical protein M434DRAFT_38918 [Hypoxylon sp. CO27-5]|nr:hypothetical protein M434DRAFT_38918 [Hypoxylon sp. CO27-5]